jgi:hypothetical protein
VFSLPLRGMNANELHSVVAIKSFVDGIDPRVRDCHGEATCAECDGAGAYIPKNGYWPCAFHLRKSLKSQSFT